MIHVRRAEERGHAEHGWLDSHHTFSFGSYHDRQWMGYGPLRVINEDRVVAGAGFSPHSHSNMEILSYVLEGALRHRDSTGGGSVLKPGEMQLMTAGRGISHSEMNGSDIEPVHFLQIWIETDTPGAEPGYQQKKLDVPALHHGFSKVAAPPGEAAPFRLLQDARLFIAWPRAGHTAEHVAADGRRHYLHVARGSVDLNGVALHAGDAAMTDDEPSLKVAAGTDAEVLLFELLG
jgi:redox-sensitive bicupin YhaK (pirin superfamily)